MAEIRPIRTDDEWSQHSFVSAYAFNGDRSDEAAARRAIYYQRDWCLGAFEGSQLIAGLVVIPFHQYLNGAAISLGGVASVSCLPERRREGHVAGLLRHALVSTRDGGQALSALWTPHYSLYRRFGYGIAGRLISFAFEPKVMRLRREAPPGSFRRVGPDDWQLLDAVYTDYHARRNGGLTRSEQRWRSHVFTDYGRGQRDAVVWSNAGGDPCGYAVYGAVHRPSSSPFGETVLRVHDWVALDAGAYAAIVGYLLNHDLVNRIVMLASQDDPLPEIFEEPVHFAEPPGAWSGPMLRLVDVPRALEARPALPQASGRSVTIALTDETAPWNAGTWHIECREGRIAAERARGAADLEMDVETLAPIYNGSMRPAEAVRTGGATTRNEEGLQAATDIFATAFSPYCPDDF